MGKSGSNPQSISEQVIVRLIDLVLRQIWETLDLGFIFRQSGL